MLRVTDKGHRNWQRGTRAILYKAPRRFDGPPNPGMFDARYYYELNNINGYVTLSRRDSVRMNGYRPLNFFDRLLTQSRRYVSRTLKSRLSEEASALLHALLLGQKQYLPRATVRQFQQTGIVHVLAISGLHVGFVVLILYGLFSWTGLPDAYKTGLTLLALFFFAALVHFKAPVVRASVMIGLYLLARLYRRPVKPLQILGAAALLILLWRPAEILLPGFQFSFAAVWGLIFGLKKWEPLIRRMPAPSPGWRFVKRYIVRPAVASLAAVLATTPFTWYYYGVVQAGAVLINILVIPFIGLILGLGILLLIIAPFSFLPVAGLGFVVSFLVHVLLTGIGYVASWPVFQWTVGAPNLWQMPATALLIWSLFHPMERRWRLTALGLLVVLLFPYKVFTTPDLRVTVLDVGQGDACFIEFPDGRTMLVDAGDRGFGFDAGAWYIEPFLRYKGVTHINYLLVTHPHADHMGGMVYLMDHFTADTLVINELTVASALYRSVLDKARQKNIAVTHWQKGDHRKIGPVALYILHPPDAWEHVRDPHGKEINNSSIVFQLRYGKTRFLFTGDAEAPSEQIMRPYGAFLQSDWLKAGHHGSRTSSSAAFIELVRPHWAVISVGRGNKFRHPSRENIRRFARHGIQVLRTDRVGAVCFVSDGKQVRLLRWR